jgi:hypothetical protein
MLSPRHARFESLESRLALAVTATVVDGDLVVEGDADGTVEIAAVGAGAYQVTDNGVMIADGMTLQGVTDDIRINIDRSAAADNTVVLNLTDQEVDRVYARLGDGDNSLQLVGGTAASFFYRGGDGADSVDLGTAITSGAWVSLGDGENNFKVSSEVRRIDVKGGDDADAIAIAELATVTRSVSAYLGDGDNTFSLEGNIDGFLNVSSGDGLDTVTLAADSSVGRTVRLALGDGDNTAMAAGTVDGSLAYRGRDGNDSLTIDATAAITDNLFARLGEGDNTVTHAGNVGGDFRVVSANENDNVDIADTAVIGGETDLGLGEEQDLGGRCRGGRGIGFLGDVARFLRREALSRGRLGFRR